MDSGRTSGINRERRTVLKATGVGTSIGLLAGCLGGNGGDDTVIIGGLQPYSGPFAGIARAYEEGLEFAINEINEEGGVLDRELGFDGIDTQTEAGEAVSIARQFVQEEGAVALVGPMSSDVGITAADTAEELEVPLFLHTAGTHAALSRDSRFTYRVGLLPAPICAQAQAQLVENEGYENVGAIIADYAWGHAFQDGIEEFFPEDINLNMTTAPADENDFTPHLRDLPNDLDILLGSAHPPGVHDMYRQMLELGIEPEVCTAAVEDPESSFETLGESIDRGFAPIHQADLYSDDFRDVAERFYDETGGYMGPSQAVGYVTVQIIASGIESSDSVDPVEISNAVREIELDTIFAEPIRYTEWGELDQQVQLYSQFELEAPDYYPEGDFRPVETFRSEPLDPLDPDAPWLS